MSKKLKKRTSSAKKRQKSDMPVSVEDLGPIERWRHKFGMSAPKPEQIAKWRENFSAASPTAEHHAAAVRQVSVLEIRDRTVDGGGRVTGTGAHNRFEQPLDYMYEHGWLGDRSTEEGERIAHWRLQAGTRFRGVFEGASIQRRTTVNLDTVGGGGIYHEDSDEEDENRTEYRTIMRGLGQYGPIATAVCCLRNFLPQNNARLLDRLLRGLDFLTDHFNIRDDERKRRHTIRGTMYD